MSARILVAYATRNGSTAEIAQAICQELVSAGHAVDVTEIKKVSTLAGYSAIVIGGPLYMGSVDGAVGKFVEREREQLLKLLVAAFVVGLAPKNPDPGAVEAAMAALRKSLGPVTPVSSVLFAGKLDPAKVNFVMRKFWRWQRFLQVTSGTGTQLPHGHGSSRGRWDSLSLQRIKPWPGSD